MDLSLPLALASLAILIAIALIIVFKVRGLGAKPLPTPADEQPDRATLLAKLELAERQSDELREDQKRRDEQIANLQRDRADRDATIARLETTLDHERKAMAEKLALIDQAESRFRDTFKALSADALKASSEEFLGRAKETFGQLQEQAKGDLDKRQTAIGEMVKPVRETLDKMDGKIADLEKARVGAYEALKTQVQSMAETHQGLRTETASLVRALRSPSARGRWGEMQLRRVVEMAGMLDHCDFVEQGTVDGDGQRLRPDLVVHLPGGKTIAVDAKTPLDAYLDAMATEDDTDRRAHIQDHARRVREHMKQLGSKTYWQGLEHSPEFVVLFLPGEHFYSAALEADPKLIEIGVSEHSVVPASPTSLITLLKAAAYGWRQERLADEARNISKLGADLYQRVGTLADHMDKLGRQLDGAVGSYNKAVGSLESRVLVSARRFKDLHAVSADTNDIGPPRTIETASKPLTALEFADPDRSDADPVS